ncbi:hypothetical protein HUJ04_001121 [Dendroctonus ponderosae]|nr:hypothetical protein HUJ04_001121 [Dendroctonus ponderosae]
MKLMLLFSCALCAIFQRSSTECINLERIFRTPKDMSKINFDHLELVERSDFDRFDTSTTKPPATTPPQQSGPNVANAQVVVRFGGDEGHPSSHIMRIPPHARYFPGGHEVFYPPPPLGYNHYYHPYPPPVPFVFPNYYFRDTSAHFLPPPLSDYFQRHPEFFNPAGQVFIQGRPLRREEVGGSIHIVKVANGRDARSAAAPPSAVPVVVVGAAKGRTPIAKRSCQAETAFVKSNLVSGEEGSKSFGGLGELQKRPCKAANFTSKPSKREEELDLGLPPSTDKEADFSLGEQKGDTVTIVVALEDAEPSFIPHSQFPDIQLALNWGGLLQKKPPVEVRPAPTLPEKPPRIDAKGRVLEKKASGPEEFSYFFLPEPNVVLRPVENCPGVARDGVAVPPLVCTKCGQRLAGGNFCSHCGCPAVLDWPFCASCAPLA